MELRASVNPWWLDGLAEKGWAQTSIWGGSARKSKEATTSGKLRAILWCDDVDLRGCIQKKRVRKDPYKKICVWFWDCQTSKTKLIALNWILNRYFLPRSGAEQSNKPKQSTNLFLFANQRTISRCLLQLLVTTAQIVEYVSRYDFCSQQLRFVVECRKTISNYQRKLNCILAYRLVSSPPLCNAINGDLHKATDSWERFWVEVAGNRQPGWLGSYYMVRGIFGCASVVGRGRFWWTIRCQKVDW